MLRYQRSLELMALYYLSLTTPRGARFETMTSLSWLQRTTGTAKRGINKNLNTIIIRIRSISRDLAILPCYRCLSIIRAAFSILYNLTWFSIPDRTETHKYHKIWFRIGMFHIILYYPCCRFTQPNPQAFFPLHTSGVQTNDDALSTHHLIIALKMPMSTGHSLAQTIGQA